ncbi:Alanine--tRNA ligase [Candidatus Gugararchaeum adminiculabundum]|nr:Alanine--tRNA ligase [Candidatus Gugararchaeum adminiculabundum]
MNHKEIAQKFLDFFKSKGHTIIPSASLIPENDPTVLFTTAGMHPLVPFLLGQPHPGGKRLVDNQKSLRTDDIEEVGDAVHHTFFFMLGNWSLGDYFKKEAIEWSHEFLTDKKWLGLDKKRIAVSCFAGDKDAPKDEEAASVWRKLGIPESRIAFLPKKDNWWGPAGATGPCGPDTEMFYWSPNTPAPEKFDSKDKRWVEIWNDVFMQYSKNQDATFTPLKQKNVDTGMGLERACAVLQGFDDNYKTELFAPIIAKLEHLSNKKYGSSPAVTLSMRIIADHVRASVFVLAENKVTPSNVEQGYVLRRLLRRSVRHLRELGINISVEAGGVSVQKGCMKGLAEIVIDIYRNECPELEKNRGFIINEINSEQFKFMQTIEHGIAKFEQILSEKKAISATDAFLLYQSFGFPLEMTAELAKERGITVDKQEFEKEFEKHQELSRKGAEQKFKSGLADHSEKTIKLHTATHLLHAALRKIVGPNATQKGSNITPERLRFDFNSPEKLTPEQLKQVEALVNEVISQGIEVQREEMTMDQAKKAGALGLFESKYGEKVSVYTIGTFSKEICTGPHVKNTREIGKFRIQKEESIAAGVRRIKAVIE